MDLWKIKREERLGLQVFHTLLSPNTRTISSWRLHRVGNLATANLLSFVCEWVWKMIWSKQRKLAAFFLCFPCRCPYIYLSHPIVVHGFRSSVVLLLWNLGIWSLLYCLLNLGFLIYLIPPKSLFKIIKTEIFIIWICIDGLGFSLKG